MSAAARALLLLVLANSAPWVVARVLGQRLALPLDFGCLLPDGKRLFGDHKTWRGLVAGSLSCAIAAPCLQLPWNIGAGFGAASLLGDALSSAIKRRFGLAPGTEVPGLDQLPEALLPLLLFATLLGLGATGIVAVTFGFMALNLLAIRLRQPRRHQRQRDERSSRRR